MYYAYSTTTHLKLYRERKQETSRLDVICLSLRLLMSYIYIWSTHS